jgi:SAM-dependent methyltransferase
MSLYQYRLPGLDELVVGQDYRTRLAALLARDLDFHSQDSEYAARSNATHNLHSFPAKFPPQLPRAFILGLTEPGDVVLDPMAGSGTTIVEALLAGRQGIGLDIDPLALRISRVKTTPLDVDCLMSQAQAILKGATTALAQEHGRLEATLQSRWDENTRRFVDYWFDHQTQLELVALVDEIARVPDPRLRSFFELAFSSIIVTKSGGVSLALDLGHTRPHKARFVMSRSGQLLHGPEAGTAPSGRDRILTKILRSSLEEFNKRVQVNIRGLSLLGLAPDPLLPWIGYGDAQYLPLRNDSVDLITTSPPYASNAIDYMRAHKFSLVWLGYAVDELGERRKGYVGGEALADVLFEELPPHAAGIVDAISALDAKRGQVLRRYYAEMTRVLREMHRVLKPGKAAIVVVGSSVMRGRDTETHLCLAEIGRTLGFAGGQSGTEPLIGVRNLDRNRRMMPAGAQVDLNSQIQQRMHQEYVIGFYKPGPGES